MKNIVLLLAFVGFWGLNLHAQKSKWDTYTYASPGFSIDFPIKPQAQTEKVETEIGLLQLNMLIAEVDMDVDENLIYTVNTTVYPSEYVHSDNESSVQEYVDGMRLGLHEDLMTLKSEKDYKFKGYPGVEFESTYTDMDLGEITIISKVFLVKNVGYMLQVYTLGSEASNKSSKQFFNSMKLLK